MTSALMRSACGIYSGTAGDGFRRTTSCLPHTGSPITLQSSHRKTCQHSSKHRKMTRPLTPWRLHLEDTSAPLRLSLLKIVLSVTQRAVANTRTQAYAHTQNHTHKTHCARWLTGTADCSTSQTPFQTGDNWLTAHRGLVAGREHVLYLPTGRVIAQHLMVVIFTTLKFISMALDIKSSLIESPD